MIKDNNGKGEPDFAVSEMDVVTAICTRRSIRQYTAEVVSDLQINTILHAGLSAPTARNRRPFHFFVIRDRGTLAKLAATKGEMLNQAPCAMVVCGDRDVEDRLEFRYADCFAATQNILLAIHGLGLGGVWVGVGADSDFAGLLKEVLSLPEEMEPTAVIALGHPAEEKPRPMTWDAGKIHWEKMGGQTL